MLFMVGLGLWATLRYFSLARGQSLEAYAELRHAFKYFDTNRNMPGIHSLKLTKKTETCQTTQGYRELGIYRWPGSVAGYKKDGKFYKGTPGYIDSNYDTIAK